MSIIDNRVLLFAGAALIAVAGWFFKWLIQRSLTTQFNKMEAAAADGRKEREYDQYLALRGQQVTNDCLHELIYAVINGTHNGGLKKANDELEAFRIMVDQNMAEKAARWTDKIAK